MKRQILFGFVLVLIVASGTLLVKRAPVSIANSGYEDIEAAMAADAIPGHIEDQLAAQPKPTQTPLEIPTSHLRATVRSEAARLYSTGENPQTGDERLAALARSVNAADAEELKVMALDSKLAESERFLAVYLLGERASEFTPALVEIARAPTPLDPVGPDLAPQAEVAVRIQAMIALDAIGSTPTLQKLFAEIEKDQAHPILRRLAHLGTKGAMNREPMIANYLDMEMSEIMDEVD